MNTLQHFLPELEVDSSQVGDALRAVLHTILFNRSLGPVLPSEKTLPSFKNITYVSCGLTEVEEKVDEAISSFCKNLSLVGPSLGGGQLWLSFYEKRKKKAFFGIQSNEEKLYWERWVIPVVVNLSEENVNKSEGVKTETSEEKDRILRYEKRRQREMAEKCLSTTLFQVVKLVNAKNSNHIPPVNLNSENAMLFQYEISIPNEPMKSGRSADFWINKVNNVILKGPDVGFMSIYNNERFGADFKFPNTLVIYKFERRIRISSNKRSSPI